MRKTIVALCLALTGVFALTAAGCGGGGSKSAATTAAATTEATQTQTQATTTEAPPATTKATTTTSSLGGLTAGKCKALAGLQAKFASAFTGAAQSGDLKKEADILKQAAGEAPSAIKGDVETLADYLSKVADVAGKVKPGAVPDAGTQAKLQEILSQGQQKIQAAVNHLEAWAQQNC